MHAEQRFMKIDHGKVLALLVECWVIQHHQQGFRRKRTTTASSGLNWRLARYKEKTHVSKQVSLQRSIF